MPSTIVVGGFFGDEGKGKIVAYLAKKDKPHIVARGGVGPNAGHTVIIEGKKYGLSMVPSGFVHEKARLLIGSGVLINPEVLKREISQLKLEKQIGIDWRCAIIEERHIEEDKKNEELKGKISTTGTGCGPANAERALRRIKQAKEEKQLEEFLCDAPLVINNVLNEGKYVLVEGTQGFGISLFYGTYPYVTSKDTTASQIAADVGIGPTKVDDVIIVFKSFPTRVGAGPFETEISEKKSFYLNIEEYGTVTGRKRRIGMWDSKMASYAAMINGATMAALSGLDRMDVACKGIRKYEELSKEVKNFVEKVEKELHIPVVLLSTGPEISEMVDLRAEKCALK